MDTNTYTFAGYDCMAILIDAIGRAIDTNGGKIPSRKQVIDQLAKTTNFRGLTGTHTFNADGDSVTPTLQILQYKPPPTTPKPGAGTWTPVKNITIGGS